MREDRSEKLTRQLLPILIGAALAPLILLGMLITLNGYIASRSGAIEIQQHIAQRAADTLEQRLTFIQQKLTLYAETAPHDAARREQLLAQEEWIDEIAILDANGAVMELTLRPDETGCAARFAAAHAAPLHAVLAGQTYRAALRFSELDAPRLLIALPAAADSAAVVACVNLQRALVEIGASVNGAGQNAPYTTYIADERDLIVAHPTSTYLSHAVGDVLHLAPNSPPMTREYKGLDGQRVLGGQAPLRDWAWTLVVEQPAGAIYAPMLRSQLGFGAVLLIGAAFIVGANVFYLRRRVVQPLAAVARGAAALNDGALTQKIELPTANEIADLAHEFNRLADKLSATQRQLADVEQREQARRRASDTLREAALLVNSTLEQDKVLELILAQLQNMVICHRAQVMLLVKGILMPVAGCDATGAAVECPDLEIRQSPRVAAVLRERQPLLLPHVPQRRALGIMKNVNSFIAAPLVVKDQPLGLLAVGRRDGAAYTEDDAQMVFAFANQVAVALESARLHEYELAQVERELVMARQLQTSLLPPTAPRVRGLDIAGFSQPARLAGGDFYNYFVFDRSMGTTLWVNPYVGIGIGDVSGKGMQAALMMALSFGLLTNAVRRPRHPADLLARLNREIRSHTRRSRLTTALGYVTLEPNKRAWIVRAANAGLVSPLVRRSDGGVEWLDVTGLPLGMMEDARYKELKQTLHPGDMLLLSSDGIAEAKNAAGDLYGFDRVLARLAEMPRSRGSRRSPVFDAPAVVEWMLEDVREFVGGAEQHDDVTLIVVTVKEP